METGRKDLIPMDGKKGKGPHPLERIRAKRNEIHYHCNRDLLKCQEVQI